LERTSSCFVYNFFSATFSELSFSSRTAGGTFDRDEISRMVGSEQNIDKSSALYKKLLKMNKDEKDTKKGSEPTILEISSLSKVPPAVLEEKLNSEKVAEKKL
jgi:hypothetical protein